ncbi:MAG: uracil-DNA glycosylase [Thermodesulfobacteriaceae bacterium]|nr:uracil-DNA glycosylase [Thermodesulfobacteriaceae bacterium]MCX8041073.1 uracil-DNA glycosylase [Thermodesulfobacteriaceae bacterium]MDW8135514.1 uracil-DNA glycosylase [Thermodesulfobacterium sp.]
MENLFKEVKNYLRYLKELGISEVPYAQEWKNLFQIESFYSQETFETLKERVLNCKDCALHRIRKRPIWGDGNPEALLMLITEYPDREEDFYERPLVGMVGEFLKKMFLSIKLTWEHFFITHTVKCKTPGGRPPEPEEIQACKKYLLKQIKLLKPKLILALGFTPVKVFLEHKVIFSHIRGQVFNFQESMIVFTYHPNYIFKNPSARRLIWEDFQKFKKLYEEIFKNS